MAAQASPIATDTMPRVPRSMRVDPARHLVPDDVPQSILDNWHRMLGEAETTRLAQQRQYEAELATSQKHALRLRGIVMDASMMSRDLIALAYLFDKALIEDADADSDLLKASHLVVDVMKTIAARLGALDDRAGLAIEEARL
ncbi:hypothetical protein ASF60_19910 [Methylobacterium sp. Leaf113]|uniref:hypothetical protein n=1 Tax=Methylobacterium sp. Leaf113 TaxID=1736259 RepID=UPI0006FD0E10|nr:hypothetical protein [Methylobacterium sp. Leaf113]KQP89010.1 hypothetical protein ASF60_19910 [Methylobacterium sp. Leaf113]